MQFRLSHVVNAWRLGVFFTRNRAFELPDSIKIGTKRQTLAYPGESGARIDFLGCLVWNEYGLGQKMSEPKHIVDIGANLGFFSLAARTTYPNAEIHSYEPNPRILPYLQENVKGLNIEVYPEAVGMADGQVSMDDKSDSNQASTVAGAECPIRQIAFSTVLERVGGTIDLLKLDCEGAEWDIFKAAGCWRNVANVRMEYHLGSSHSFSEVADTLKGFGFRVLVHRPSSTFGIVWAARPG
jgi:FkbM family methyltransferase